MTILFAWVKYFSLRLLRVQKNCHPDRSAAQWRDLRFFSRYSHTLISCRAIFSNRNSRFSDHPADGRKLVRVRGNCPVLQSAKDEEAFPHAWVAFCTFPALL